MPTPCCTVAGCVKRALYGVPGQGKTLCTAHKRLDPVAIDLNSKKCAVSGCGARARYAAPGEAASLCSTHKHMVDNATFADAKKCCVEGCGARARFGVAGHKDRLCSTHKSRMPGAKNLDAKTCEVVGCDARARYGIPSEGVRVCPAHKYVVPGSDDLDNKKCIAKGCGKYASFGVPGLGKSVCGEHRDLVPGAKNIHTKRCMAAGCETIPCYGVPGHGKRVCIKHIQLVPGAVNLVRRTCAEEGCDVTARTGFLFCASHDRTNCRRTHVREMQVFNYLKRCGLLADAWDKMMPQSGCTAGRYRPDFVFARETHIVIVEVDEFQHDSYPRDCENKRMLEIWNAFQGLPVVFVRFNPDAYMLTDQLHKTRIDTRLKLLESVVRNALDTLPNHLLTIVRLFYNNPHGDKAASVWIDPDDPQFLERPTHATPST